MCFFGNDSKSKAAMKKMKFPAELDLPVDRDKVSQRMRFIWGMISLET